jgi:hypothetical protein
MAIKRSNLFIQPLYIAKALFTTLQCTQAERGVLLSFLVPDIEGLRLVKDAL